MPRMLESLPLHERPSSENLKPKRMTRGPLGSHIRDDAEGRSRFAGDRSLPISE